MTPKQKHNYKSSGRRVRPTTPKLTKPQRAMLETLSQGYLIYGQITTRRWFNPRVMTWEYRKKLSGQTFLALHRLGYVEEADAPGAYKGVEAKFSHWFQISDTGRAALEATKS